MILVCHSSDKGDVGAFLEGVTSGSECWVVMLLGCYVGDLKAPN